MFIFRIFLSCYFIGWFAVAWIAFCHINNLTLRLNRTTSHQVDNKTLYLWCLIAVFLCFVGPVCLIILQQERASITDTWGSEADWCVDLLRKLTSPQNKCWTSVNLLCVSKETVEQVLFLLHPHSMMSSLFDLLKPFRLVLICLPMVQSFFSFTF